MVFRPIRGGGGQVEEAVLASLQSAQVIFRGICISYCLAQLIALSCGQIGLDARQIYCPGGCHGILSPHREGHLSLSYRFFPSKQVAPTP